MKLFHFSIIFLLFQIPTHPSIMHQYCYFILRYFYIHFLVLNYIIGFRKLIILENYFIVNACLDSYNYYKSSKSLNLYIT